MTAPRATRDRRIAEAATAGEWTFWTSDEGSHTIRFDGQDLKTDGDPAHFIEWVHNLYPEDGDQWMDVFNNAAHIANFDPPHVTRMLAVIEAAEILLQAIAEADLRYPPSVADALVTAGLRLAAYNGNGGTE